MENIGGQWHWNMLQSLDFTQFYGTNWKFWEFFSHIMVVYEMKLITAQEQQLKLEDRRKQNFPGQLSKVNQVNGSQIDAAVMKY